MEKDVIIGGAAGYKWNDLKYWINSIKKSGFEGDVVLVATDIDRETIEKLTAKGVILALYGKQNKDGGFTRHSTGPSHVERFFYMWNHLRSCNEKYRYVITTDTRDVVFQKNPSLWLLENLGGKKIVCSSEGIQYKNEPWGNQNLLETFGPYFHQLYKDELVYNVGTIGGRFEEVKDLMLMIFQLSINRPIPIVDQAVFNFILNQEPYKSNILKTTNENLWALQLGTTIEAIKSGSGDIGGKIAENPTEYLTYQLLYKDVQPEIMSATDGTEAYFYHGKTLEGERKLFTIVHQYDRVKDIKECVQKLYGDD